jgi:hypothetical protein
MSRLGLTADTGLIYAAKSGEHLAGYLTLICQVESITEALPDGWQKNALMSAARAGRQNVDRIDAKYLAM